MKRFIFSIILTVVFASFVSGQTNSGNDSKNTGTSSTGTKRTASSKTKKGTKGKTVTVNQRKEYKRNNGQTATPTGQEATGVNSANAAAPKDTTKRRQ